MNNWLSFSIDGTRSAISYHSALPKPKLLEAITHSNFALVQIYYVADTHRPTLEVGHGLPVELNIGGMSIVRTSATYEVLRVGEACKPLNFGRAR